MFLYKMIALVLLTAALTAGTAFCQDANNDQEIKIITGTVTHVDSEGSSMVVKTDSGGIMLFYISVESNLLQETHHISSIEIKPGDPVKIKYSGSSGKNMIIKLLDSQPVGY